MEYELIRTQRKSVALRLLPDGSLVVRAPQRLPRQVLDALVEEKRVWIETRREQLRRHALLYPEPDAEEEAALRRLAREQLPGLVERYADRMGVRPTGLRVTSARGRFGSCSGKNSLSFSWRLLRYPREAVEAVVVHELAHIRHKNHQKEFYAFVLSVMPDYYERIRLLKR